MTGEGVSGEPARRRLDQWLWFARFAKSRSLASRLCGSGAVAVNGKAVNKPNYTLRIGDTIVFPQGALRRTVRVLALGVRRGPSTQARLLYEEAATPARIPERAPVWEPLLWDNGPASGER